MEEYLDQKTTEYNPENVYFGNIRDIFSNPDGSVSINRNTFDLKRMRPSEQFKIETSFDPNLSKQEYLSATITANTPLKPLDSGKLARKTSKEL